MSDIPEACWHIFAETTRAPEALRRRLLAAATRETLNSAKVGLARVRFGKGTFSFDEDGRWAVTAPIAEERWSGFSEIADIAAFDIEDTTLKQTYRGIGFAVGIGDAMLDARLHSNYRIRVHADVWPWIKQGCAGLLPVDWTRTALFLKSSRVGGLLTARSEGAAVQRRIRLALQPPPHFVVCEQVPT